MFNPGQIYKTQQASNSLIKQPIKVTKTSQIDLSSFQNIGKSRWDEPIMLPPILYTKLGVPFPASASNPNTSINNKYPPQLLNYIARSYSKCKNESQKMLMEIQLRDVIRKYETDLEQVNWEIHPLPSLNNNAQIGENLTAQNSRKNIKLLSCYNIVEDEKPSKAMEIAKKRLQKLEQKLNKQQIKPENEKQVFIGFSSTPIQKPKFPSFTSKPLAPSSTLTPTVTSKIFEFPKPIIIKTQNTEITSKDKNHNQKQLEKDKLKQKQKDKKERQRQREREKEKERQRQKEKHKSKSDKDKQDRKEQLSKNKQQKIKNGKPIQEKVGLIKKSKESQLEQMAKRFKGFNKLQSDKYQKDALEDSDVELGEVIVGKSQSIDKPYLRITGRPNPETVRPEPVLKKALTFHFHIYEGDKGEHGYEALISQLKSIRQDLTVQHIKNGFTVHVYEQNLEVSLFEKDIPQFKHCQTTLWQLYCEGLCYSEQSRNKFISHQMLTLLMEDKNQELEYMLTRVPQSCLSTHQIMQCLKLKQQLIVGNYRGFFDFYQRQGKFNKCLLDLYLGKMLIKFLLMICKTCGQKVPLKSLCAMVGSQSASLLQEIITKEGGIIEGGMLILKPSFDLFAKSEHLASKKVTVLMN